jgi:hypothetical protein
MDLTTALALAAGLLALALFAGWRGARPPNLLRGPRLVPWRAIMVMAAAGLLFTAAYIGQLVGPQKPN